MENKSLLTVTHETADSIKIVVLDGPVDSSTYDLFRKEIGSVCLPSAKVLLDCAGLTYMNSKSLGLLSSFHRQQMVDMGRLALSGLNRKLVKTMDLLGLGQMLKLYETRDQALEALKSV
jgi:anti-sigma B factor antagonist